MSRLRPPLGLTCPGCGSELEPLGHDGTDEVHRLHCLDCGETFRARRRPRLPATRSAPAMGGFALALRVGMLRMVPPIYRIGVGLGSVGLFAIGGFVPVIRGWLADRLDGPGGVVEALGGVRVASESRDPDNDFGPVLRRLDAPRLFDEVADVARRLGVRPPEEIRLAFLPCCGVVAWRRSRALLLGMPLLHVLTIAELRAVLAHELAHLARGDATWSAGSLRFVEALSRALDDPSRKTWGPLGLWARLCRKASTALIGPISRGQEARADRASAALAGGRVAASALVKVALVQPLFRELLGLHEAGRPDGSNLYSTFRAFWTRLPEPLMEAMRLRLVAIDPGSEGSPHPPLPDRIAMVQSYPDLPDGPTSIEASWTLIGDPEWLEQMLDDRLYGLAAVEPTVFHKAGT
jgi:Zn-dependent protease with chaperone function